MNILFTGASSLTGMWFVKELANAGHRVTAVFRSPQSNYEGLRKERIKLLNGTCEAIFNCPFGSEAFLDLAANGGHWDILCHHAAEVLDYKSPDFDFTGALANNTRNLERILGSLQKQGCNKILLTGSVFEQNEGKGSDNLRAVSPYGLSKGITTEVFKYFTATLNLKLGKFVIPNPFGPFEEPRYTTYLIKSWYSGKAPAVKTPVYVRDNIHVSLLAKAYAYFALKLSDMPGFEKFNPSCYAESQADFTARFAREISNRLSIPCQYELQEQTEFPEPKVRINTDLLDCRQLAWKESMAWDELAEYYQKTYGKT